MRLDGYRSLAQAGTREELETLRSAWRDRFGPLPGAAENALIAAAIRLEASKRRIPLVEVRGEKLMLTRGGSFILIGGRFPRLTGSDPDSRVREVLSVLEKMPN